eukprot:1614129-Pyramimonas_sp.AAC.1
MGKRQACPNAIVSVLPRSSALERASRGWGNAEIAEQVPECANYAPAPILARPLGPGSAQRRAWAAADPGAMIDLAKIGLGV